MKRVIIGLAVLGCAAGSAAGNFEYPKRKPGEWQVTIHSANAKLPPRVESVCLDAATDQLLYQVGLGATQKLCAESHWAHGAGGRIVADLTCQLGGTHARVHAEITVSGDSAYHEDITTHYDPPLYGKSELVSTHDAHWLGVCPADMKPGDVVVKPSPAMPMSLRMNLTDMLKKGQ
jgi:hypothetical protein